jgi:hypothetical protein
MRKVIFSSSFAINPQQSTLNQSGSPGQQFLHHALLEGAGLAFNLADGVHIILSWAISSAAVDQ